MKTCLDCKVLPPFSIQLCLMHAVAEEMLTLLQSMPNPEGYKGRREYFPEWDAKRRALLARIAG